MCAAPVTAAVVATLRSALCLAACLCFTTACAAGPSTTPDFALSRVPGTSAPVATGMDTPGASGANAPGAKFVPMFDPVARWSDGVYRWKYNHANAPASLASSKASVIAQLQAAFDKWSAQCGVRYQYDGETTALPNVKADDPNAGTQPDFQSVIAWGNLPASLSGWTYDWWQALAGGGRSLVDADTLLNAASVTSLADLDRVATHEAGHALGLDHSDMSSAIMAGPPLTAYNSLVTPQEDDVRGCRCLYGMPAGASAGYACNVPRQVDFGDTPVASASAPQSVTMRNDGNAPLAIVSAAIGDGTFQRVAGCDPGSTVPPGASCTMQVVATPNRTGVIASKLQVFASDGYHEVALTAAGTAVAPSSPPATPPAGGTPASASSVNVIEFYNPTLDHYFITWIAAEINKLDAGLTPSRWVRTGLSFKAYVTPQAGTATICRFYIPPADGNSHFFGRSAAECAAVQQQHPDFVLEDATYMHLYLPSAGACPAGTAPIYRLFNGRADANHRYTTDRGVRDQMVARGWIAEGDGPDRVVMCAPQ